MPSGAQSHRRRVQIGVFGAEAYSCTLSTENVEMGPYPTRVSAALGGEPLDHGNGGGGEHAAGRKAGVAEQALEVGAAPLAAVGADHHHLQVDHRTDTFGFVALDQHL